MSTYLDSFDTQLRYFNAKVVTRFPPASVEMIAAAEGKLGVQLSPQCKAFLQRYNGIHIVDAILHGVPLLDPRKRLTFTNLVKENLAHRDSTPGWPQYWLSLGEDGFGNPYVADTSRTDEHGEYPILLVDHETIGEEDCSELFTTGYFDFLQKVLTEMIARYHPDGHSRTLPRGVR